jgi:hypothetical protein
MIGSRVSSSIETMKDGRIRASITVDGQEVEHKWFARGQAGQAGEWTKTAVMRVEDEVYQNAKG